MRRKATEPPAQTQPSPTSSPNPANPIENPPAAPAVPEPAAAERQPLARAADDRLARATGTDSPELAMKLLHEVIGSRLHMLNGAPVVAAGAAGPAPPQAAAAIAALDGIAPRDAMEGMLAAQMVVVHDAAMNCLHDATDPRRPFPCRDSDMRLAARLMTLYGRHMELLDRRRGPVPVGRVQVESGGQAIVGTVNLPGHSGKTAGDTE